MQADDWKRFLASGQRHEKTVAHISAYLNGYVMATSHEVRMAHEYALKAIEKHGLQPEHLTEVRETIHHGEAILDRDRHITFFYRSPKFDRWFQVTVKCCTTRRRLFVVTFHAMSEADITRKRKKFQTVWPLK